MNSRERQKATAYLRQLLVTILEHVLMAQRYPGPHTRELPAFDIEAFLGDAWFAEQSRKYQCDARALLRQATPTMLEDIGRAAVRLLAPPLARRED